MLTYWHLFTDAPWQSWKMISPTMSTRFINPISTSLKSLFKETLFRNSSSFLSFFSLLHQRQQFDLLTTLPPDYFSYAQCITYMLDSCLLCTVNRGDRRWLGTHGPYWARVRRSLTWTLTLGSPGSYHAPHISFVGGRATPTLSKLITCFKQSFVFNPRLPHLHRKIVARSDGFCSPHIT